jgi:SAM-dependent methyltransferase
VISGEDMFETSKGNLRRIKERVYLDIIFVGCGIDIGAGADPLNKNSIYPNITNCENFDVNDGNAQYINRYRQESNYDFVYSSNCLEHLDNPYVGIKNWFSLVKPGGYLVLVVPDEDLYEQGHWPSKFSTCHNWSFTIEKKTSWCPRSINLVDMFKILTNAELINVKLIDTNYNYALINVDQTLANAECCIETILKKKGAVNE